MKDNQAKYPQLRFKGFTDPWEKRKLGDVVGEIQSGNRLPKDSLTSGNIPYVVAQTKNEGVFKTISKKTLDYNGNPMKLFPGNSISFSIDNPEAMFYRSTDFYTSNIMRVIHADYLSHQQYLFILENMKSFTRRYDWSRKFSGPVVSNLEYLQPTEQEQCKIGSFILAFDNIITLHQRKLAKLKELKQGYLQKMFPQNGSKFPQLRFAGFADAWEQRKLGEITISFDSQRVPLESSTRQSGSYPYYGATGVIDSVNDYIFDGEYVLLAEDGANIVTRTSPIAYLTHGKFWLNNHAHIMKVREGSDYFLLSLLEKIDYSKFNSGTAQPKLNSKTVSGLNVMIPTAQEQMHIAALLRSLDKAIALHQRKLEKLQELKKGYLQKMFC